MAGVFGMMLFIVPIAWFFWKVNKLFSEKPQQEERRTIRTSKDLSQVAGAVQSVARELMANVDKIQDDPLDEFSGAAGPELAVVLHGEVERSRDSWAVQVYAAETDSGCQVELVALGQGFSKGYSMGVYVGRLSIKHSSQYMYMIASRL